MAGVQRGVFALVGLFEFHSISLCGRQDSLPRRTTFGFRNALHLLEARASVAAWEAFSSGSLRCLGKANLVADIRLRPERANHVWSYDFVKAMTHDGRALRILVVIDEYTRECLALRVARRLGSLQVIETLADVMLVRGIPEHIRSDNGPEFIAEELRKWLGKVGTRTLYIEPGSPWENGYCESFNGKLRAEFLNGEIFYSRKWSQILMERWRVEYNPERPHSALGYRPPAPQAILPKQPGHGDMENAPRFPHPHTPGGDDGQMSNKALH